MSRIVNRPDMGNVERFMRENTALYWHYHVEETVLCIEQFTGIQLTSEQALELIQKLRDEHQLGPIDAFNLPGHEE